MIRLEPSFPRLSSQFLDLILLDFPPPHQYLFELLKESNWFAQAERLPAQCRPMQYSSPSIVQPLPSSCFLIKPFAEQQGPRTSFWVSWHSRPFLRQPHSFSGYHLYPPLSRVFLVSSIVCSSSWHTLFLTFLLGPEGWLKSCHSLFAIC